MMGRKHFPVTLTVSVQYPYEPPEKVKAERQAYGFTNFSEYFYNIDKVKKQKQEEERKAEKDVGFLEVRLFWV